MLVTLLTNRGMCYERRRRLCVCQVTYNRQFAHPRESKIIEPTTTIALLLLHTRCGVPKWPSWRLCASDSHVLGDPQRLRGSSCLSVFVFCLSAAWMWSLGCAKNLRVSEHDMATNTGGFDSRKVSLEHVLNKPNASKLLASTLWCSPGFMMNIRARQCCSPGLLNTSSRCMLSNWKARPCVVRGWGGRAENFTHTEVYPDASRAGATHATDAVNQSRGPVSLASPPRCACW